MGRKLLGGIQVRPFSHMDESYCILVFSLAVRMRVSMDMKSGCTCGDAAIMWQQILTTACAKIYHKITPAVRSSGIYKIGD